MLTKLMGYKTYITAILSIIGTILGMVYGDISIVDGLQIIVPAILAAFVRHAVTTESAKNITTDPKKDLY